MFLAFGTSELGIPESLVAKMQKQWCYSFTSFRRMHENFVNFEVIELAELPNGKIFGFLHNLNLVCRVG